MSNLIRTVAGVNIVLFAQSIGVSVRQLMLILLLVMYP